MPGFEVTSMTLNSGAFSHSAGTVWAQLAHSANYYAGIPGAPLKTTHVQKHA